MAAANKDVTSAKPSVIDRRSTDAILKVTIGCSAVAGFLFSGDLALGVCFDASLLYGSRRATVKDTILLFAAVLSVHSVVVEAFASLNYAPLDDGKAGRCVRVVLNCTRYYSDWWWRCLDQAYGSAIFICLIVLCALPLASYQSNNLFASNFARLIAERTRRRQLVADLLL